MIDWIAIKEAAGWDPNLQRQALNSIYGNFLGDINDDAYMQRKRNAAMHGSRSRQLMAAYNAARNGQAYNTKKVYSRIGDPYARQPVQQTQASYGMPRFQNNPYGDSMRRQYDNIQYTRNRINSTARNYRDQASLQAGGGLSRQYLPQAFDQRQRIMRNRMQQMAPRQNNVTVGVERPVR